MEMPHILLYDGECGLCDRSVQTIIKIDKKHLFAFAPLQGPTAEQLLAKLPPLPSDVDSIILIENFRSKDPKMHIRSKAIFRALWLEGGFWAILGVNYWLPAFLYDWAYRWVAKNRYKLIAQSCLLPGPSDKKRFLP